MRAYKGVELGNKKNTPWWLLSWYGVAMLFQVIVMYYTATRGTILGLLGGIIVTSVIIALFGKNQPRFRKVAIGALIAVAVLIGGFFAARTTDFVKNSPTLGRFASLSIEELNTQGRRYVWPMAFEGFKERPILGWGQENFNYVFNKYYDPRMYNQEPWFDRAHNVVLDWLIAGGILGLAGYLAMFGAVLVLVWKNKTFSLADKSIIVGLLAAYLFQNLFVFDNLISLIYFFSLLAFVHNEVVRAKTTPIATAAVTPAKNWLNRISENKIAAQVIVPAISAIVVIAMIYGLNVRPVAANRNVIRALNLIISKTPQPEESLKYFKLALEADTFANVETTEHMFNQTQKFSNAGVKAETRKEFAILATEGMDKNLKKFPNDARLLLFMGSLRNRIGDFKNAIPYLERAQELSPEKQMIKFEIGYSYLNTGEYQKASEKFKEAYDLAPGFSEAKFQYAIAALYNKEIVLANRLIAEITENGKILDERIISSYVNTGHLAEAVKLLDKQIEFDPTNPQVRFRLAAGYLALGQRTKAVETLREAVRLFPEAKKEAEFCIKEIQAGRNPTSCQ